MLNLDTIAFKTDTGQLTEVVTKLKAIKDATESLSVAQTRAATNDSKVAQAAAKAEEAKAKAILQSIKVREAEEKVIEKTAATAERTSKQSLTTLEKQTLVLEKMTQGYSRGQASIMTVAQAAGATNDELEKLGKTLQSQRTLMGNDPFDKSLGALRALRNEYSVVREQVRLYNADLGLSRQQSESLARDKLRLVEASKIEGKSLFSVREQIKSLNIEYIRVANAENQLIASHQKNVKATADTAKANDYLENELLKVRNATSAANAEFNKSTSNSILRFEQALKKSGKTVKEQTTLLNEYKNAQTKLQKSGGDRQVDYISRALGPQITDIFVGLSTGQAPLTVMLQQGGQLRDQFALAGIEADKMGGIMRTAASSMVTSVAYVAKAFGDLIVGAFVDTAKGIVNLALKVSGLREKIDAARYALTLGAMAGEPWYAAALKGFNILSNFLVGAFIASVAAGAAALVSLGVAAYQTVKEQNNLAKSLALTGGSLALSQASAESYVNQLSAMGVTTGVATEAMVAMAQAGVFTKEEILLVGKAAAEMSTWADIAVGDTVKAFQKLKEKPVDALIELAKTTGMVAPEVLRMVIELDKQGKSADAAALAMNTYGDVTNTQVAQMKENYNGFTTFIIDLADSVKTYWSTVFKGLFYAADPATVAASNVDMLETRLKQLQSSATFKAGVTGAVAEAKALQETIDKLKVKSQVQVDINKTKEKELEQNVRDAKHVDFYNQLRLKGTTDVMKKEQELQQLRSKLEGDNAPKTDAERKIKNDAIKQAEKELADARKKYTEKPASENYFASLMKSLTNETIKATTEQDKLTDAYTKMLQLAADPKFQKLSEAQKAKAFELLNTAHNAELATKAIENQNDVEELRNRILGKAEGLGKDYYNTVKKINDLVGKEGGLGAEEAAELVKQLGKATPMAKTMLDWYTKMQETVAKYAQAHKEAMFNLTGENNELDFRLSLLGKTEQQQRKLTIERQKEVKLAAALLEYQKDINEINDNDNFKSDNARAQAKLDAATRLAEKQKLINKEVAVQAWEYWQKEYDRISGGVTDSIVTALFEGGKAGSKKLRDVIVAELKKPVTMVVQAVVNTLLGSTIGSFMSAMGMNVAGAAGSSLLGSAATSAGGSILGNMVGGGMGSFLGGGSLAGMFSNLGAGISTGFSTLLSSGVGGVAQLGTGLMGAGSTAGGLGTLIGGIAGPLAAVGLLISGLSRTLKDTGIQGTFGGESGFTGKQYKFYKGGFLRSDKTTTEALDTETLKLLQKSFTAIRTQTKDFAEMLSLDASKIEEFTSEVKLSLWNLKPEEAQAKIQEALLTANNEMAQQLIGTWESATTEITKQIQVGFGEDMNFTTATESVEKLTYVQSEYAKDGEKAIDTLTRLSTSLTVVNSTLDDLGQKLYQTSLAGADLASSLVETFGSFENFKAQTSAYYEAFYTDEEKRINLVKNLTEELDKHNIALPKSREEYRKLVEAQDLNTEAGRKLYATLIGLSPAFAKVNDTLSDAQKIASQERRELVKAREAAAEAKRKLEEEAIAEQKKLQEESVKQAQSIFEKIKGYLADINDWLKYSLLDTSSLLSPEQKVNEAQQQFDSLFAKAAMGDAEAMKDLLGSAKTLREVARENYASSAAYSSIDQDIRNKLSSLQAGTFVPGGTKPAIMPDGALKAPIADLKAVMQATGLTFENASMLLHGAIGSAGGAFTQAQLEAVSGQGPSAIIAAIQQSNRQQTVGDSPNWSLTEIDGHKYLDLGLGGSNFGRHEVANNPANIYRQGFGLGLSMEEIQRGLETAGVGWQSNINWSTGNWANQSSAVQAWTSTGGGGGQANFDFLANQDRIKYENLQQVASYLQSGNVANAQGMVQQTSVLQSIDNRLANMEGDTRMGSIS